MPKILNILAISIVAILLSLNIHAETADTILSNGKIYSLNWGEPSLLGEPASNAPYENGQWRPDASLIAIKNNKILFVGADDNLARLIGDETNVIDLGGATVVPGLIDSHVHIAELGEILERVNLSDVTSPISAIEKLKKSSGTLAPGEWLIGQGWDEGAWANNYPNRKMLDKAFPDNPVYLRSLHGFGVWVNTQALELAGVNNQTKPPVGGEILRDDNGVATGILLNRATTLIADAVPKPSVPQFAGYIYSGMRQMAKDGFVSIHEAGAESLHIAALRYLKSNKKLPIRMYAMLSARDKALASEWQQKGPYIDPEGFLDIRSAKAYYDGALGSRGARLLEDYSDQPGHRGVSGDAYGFDASVVDGLISSGFQVGIHAIGDAGNKEVLDYLATAGEKYPESKQLRHRVEHAQVIESPDFKRFKQLALIASMEPPHAVEDKAWAEERLGSDRIKGAYAWRTLRKAGVPLTFNSDLPGSDHSIFYALHAAVTRRDEQAEPVDGWYPEQAVSIEEAIRAYTNWAAYSAFREKQTGVLKPGYWADLTVVNIDFFKLAGSSPAKILDGKVIMTMVNGEIIYQQPL
ncbi:MAG: putative amidohydrolase YtcJ [Arenicella sp.]|jgi:predicted amidohydrolase YtcJ